MANDKQYVLYLEVKQPQDLNDDILAGDRKQILEHVSNLVNQTLWQATIDRAYYQNVLICPNDVTDDDEAESLASYVETLKNMINLLSAHFVAKVEAQ
jgi:hypothetical protein